ncbi:MAG: hypothetical protein GX620_08665 [Chloroflexi bacterium]|nr:hypothetical protein [Chloroflexota bacterium]
MCEEVQALAGRIDPAMPAVLVGHFSVSGAKPGSEQGTMIGRDATVALSCLANTIWDYVALGHMHTHQDLNAGSYPPVVYSGGVERMGFDEEGQPKGFCWINLVRGRTTWEFIELAARPFVTVCADLRDEASPLMTLQRIIADHDLRDAVVRLILTLRSGQEDLLPDRDVRGLLSEAYFVSAIRRDVVPQTQPHLGELTPEGMADQGLLAEYFRAKRVDPEWAQRLQECAKLIFTPDES